MVNGNTADTFVPCGNSFAINTNQVKNKLLKAFTGLILLMTAGVSNGQTAPTLGNAAGFVLFTTNGAVTCSGTKYLTHLTGNVGSDLPGSVTGFGNVDGVMHIADGTTGLCTPDVVSLYTQLSTSIPTGPLTSPFGGGDTLVAGVYHAIGASTLTGNLILNGQGNPNALFIFQVGGVLTTNALSKVTLINGALACNVFWQINGAANAGTGSTIRGTIVANGQIDFTSTLDTLEGRALAMNAAVLESQLVAWTPIGCGSPLLTGPSAPALATTASYGVFSSIGAVTSTPVTYVIGDVGGNSTPPTGFNPLDVTGTIHSMDPSTAAAAGDLTNVYNYLVAMPADILLLDPADFGHGLVLTPHSYQITGITQLTGNLYLNAEGDANAVFVIKINGSLTTSTISKIVLLNGAQAKNVYWKVDGAVDIYFNSVFNGTMVVAGAISLETGDTLNGRAMTINGAIAINQSYVEITAAACAAPPIGGTLHACPGASSVLTDATSGGRWMSSDTTIAKIDSVSGNTTGVSAGNAGIIYTTLAGCTSSAIFTVNAAPSAITGPGSVCPGASITLIDTTLGGTWSSSNPAYATVGSATGIVTGVTDGLSIISYTLTGSCSATKSITVGVSAGTITDPGSVCIGSTILLTDADAGGIWSASNGNATVAVGLVTGISAGSDTISYTVTSICGTATTVTTITVNPYAGALSGPSSVCAGSSITLTPTVSGGIWTRSNADATVSGSVVTGATSGVDTISYSVFNVCGSATTSKTVTINALPDAGIISGLSNVCPGSSILLTESVSGGTWSSADGNASAGSTGMVSGVTAGTDIIDYTVTGFSGCSSAATKNVTINPLPNAGTITGFTSVCASSAITLTDGVLSGVWSSSNTHATIGTTGVVSGISAGTDTISYSFTNLCGTAAATYPIVVNPLPNAGIISGPGSVCIGSTITMTDGIAGGSWSSNNATLATADVVSGIVTGVAAGIPNISYSVTNLCGTAATTQVVTVNPLPYAGTITGFASVCVSSFITLSDLTAGGTWNSSNANATIGTSGLVSGISAGTDNISYSVSNICGTAHAVKAIIINALPDAGTIAGAASVCSGSSITLSDLTTGGVWSSSNFTATISGGIVTGVTPGIDTIMYTVTTFSCGSAFTSKAILIIPLPYAGAITGAANFCSGSTITLADIATGGTWSSSSASALVGTSGIVTGSNSGTAVITYSVINLCGTAITTKTIAVNPLPAVPVITTQAPSTACTGTMFQNYGTSNPPEALTTYEWTAVNAVVWAQGTGHQYALINFPEAGTAYITLNETFTGTGCTNSSTVIAVAVSSSPAQLPGVSYFNNHFVCTPANEDSYQWGYDDVYALDSTLLPGEINQDYINANPDFANKDYWVLTTSGGCLQKTYYSVPTGVQNVNSEAGISVYPNPATNIVNVTVSSSVQGQVLIEVLNMMGQLVSSIQATDNKAAIDVAGLPAGSYLVTCFNNGIKIATTRFIKN